MTLRSRVDELGKEPRLGLDKKTYEYEVSLWQIIRDYQTLLDRAMQGLEYYAEFNRYQVTPPYVDIKVAQQTLADIRKQLGDANG